MPTTYTPDSLRSLFQSAFNVDDWYLFLQFFFNASELKQTPERITKTSSDESYYLGNINTTDDYRIGLFYYRIQHGSVANKRVGLRNLVKSFINPTWGEFDAALAVFDSGDHWRLSFICDIKGEATSPKRYTYVFGSNDSLYRTPVERFLFLKDKGISFDNLKTAFSVESLAKEFYNELFEWYKWAVDEEKSGVYFPTNNDIEKRDSIDTKIIRLITRLMFVWFIKQKGLVPNLLFEAKEVGKVLKNFEALSMDDGSYYNAILQNLFFATLNRDINDEEGGRRFAYYSSKDTNSLYRYAELFCISKDEVIRLFADIPFLNGGLFECLDKTKTIDGVEQAYKLDGFTRNATQKNGRYTQRAFVPNKLFFMPEKGLFSILSRYNFTIEENTPNEQQVALDPELLGKVFENLLGVYNTETKETARNQSGSFYTPREIVNFMVDESIVSYLGDTPEVRQLLDHEFVYDNSKADIYEVFSNKLRSIKILDPACGSGAFPMGLLNRIVDILQKIKPNDNIYELKLALIENCIYGVDIQSIAVQISKLRFFISLICDCEKDSNKPNFGIPTLPNLETKFVCANSLIMANIHKFEEANKGKLDLDDPELKKMKDELLLIRNKHFHTSKRQGKINLRKEDENKRTEILSYILNKSDNSYVNQARVSALRDQIKKYEDELEKLGECFTEECSADLFQTEFIISYVDLNETRRSDLNKRIKLCHAEIEKYSQKTTPKGFEAVVAQLAQWNPYGQNAVSPFFDPEWMFGITDGFDIVIGNPPYIQLANNGGELAALYADCGYETFARTGDIYCLFYERGWQLLKQGGHLCYITSNKWMRAGYGEKTRGFFAKKSNPLLLIDFAGVKIFESATVDTNILLFSRSTNTHSTKCAVTNKQNKDSVKNLSVFVQQEGTICDFNGGESWVILSPIEQSIKRKIEAVGTPLKDWDIQINYGIKTGYNEAFIINTEKRNEILANCKDEDERKRTDELIRPILRGRDIKRYGYEWANLWLINTHNGIKGKLPRIHIEDYPAVKAHLDKYWDKISTRADQGDTPYNLRNCAYMEDFSKPKIAWASVGESYYSCIKQDFFLLDTNYFFATDDPAFLLAILNSKLIIYWINSVDTPIGNGGAYRHYKYNLDKLRLPYTNQGNKDEITNCINDYLLSGKTELLEIIDHKVNQLYGLSAAEELFIKSL